MKYKFLLLFLFASLSAKTNTVHKFYMSVMQVSYVTEMQTLQITLRVFIDDLELEIANKTQQKLQLDTDKELKTSPEILKNYLNQNLQFTINNQKKQFQYLGKKYDKNNVVFYLEITNVEKIQSFEIENKLLIHTFNEQQNLVKMAINGISKSLLLSPNKVKGFLNF